MDEKQSIGSRLGDFAYLAAVCFLAYTDKLVNWQLMSLMGGYAAARYAVKAIKENKIASRAMVETTINAITGSGQYEANKAPVKNNNPPDNPRPNRETPIPRVDAPVERGRFKRISLDWYPVLVPIAFCLFATMLYLALNNVASASVYP